MSLDHKKLAIVLGFSGGAEKGEDPMEDLEAGMEELGDALKAGKHREAAELFRECFRLCELMPHEEEE